MNWGYRIFFSFIVFIAIIITMVVISMNQDINLVAEDYYKQEIAYQDQIERIRRTSSLEKQPEISYDTQSGMVTIEFFSESVESGDILFFRPSDSNQDKLIAFPSAADGKVIVPVKGWHSGLWKVKLNWSESGEEYYFEKDLNL
jgi:hypothetical protein